MLFILSIVERIWIFRSLSHHSYIYTSTRDTYQRTIFIDIDTDEMEKKKKRYNTQCP